MTETIRRKICDVCKKEVKDYFAGSLNLNYSEYNYKLFGSFRHVEIIRKDICIDCCRKLHKAIDKVLTEASE